MDLRIGCQLEAGRRSESYIYIYIMCGYKQKLPVFDVVPELKNVPYIYLYLLKYYKSVKNLVKFTEEKKYFFTLKNIVEV